MLRIPAALDEHIRAHGLATYPEECCGVMLGEESNGAREVREVLRIDNSRAEERQRRFLITPQDYRAAEREADERGMTLLGFYHSHPDHPARPSQYDLDHALPWHSYVVLAVADGRPADMTSWVMAEDRSAFSPEELLVSS